MLRSCLITGCWLTPRCYRTWTTYRALAFTTTVWVIVRVHNRTSDLWSPTHVTLTTSLTDFNILVVDIADLTDSSHTGVRNISKLA